MCLDLLLGVGGDLINGNAKADQARRANDTERYKIDAPLEAASKENALSRALQTALQSSSQNFTGAQNDLDRKLQEMLFGTKQKTVDSAIAQGQGQMASAEGAFTEANSAPPPELTAYQDAIRQGATREQEQAQNTFKNQLSQQGVRGGQAATLLNRATGEFNQGLSKDVNQVALDAALERQRNKSNFYGNKAATGQKAALLTA